MWARIGSLCSGVGSGEAGVGVGCGRWGVVRARGGNAGQVECGRRGTHWQPLNKILSINT